MPIEMYKGTFGGWNELQKDDHKHEATHVLLSLDEYDDLINKIESLSYARRKAEYDRDNGIAKARKDAEAYKKQCDENAAERIAESEAGRAAAEEAARIANDLNVNLRRLAIERANQQRGIVPKKAHDGYVVLSSRPWQEHVSVRDGRKTVHKTVQVWKSVLQTPYSVSIKPECALNVARKQDMLDGTLLSDLGCDGIFNTAEAGIYHEETDDEGNRLNVIYRIQLVADLRSGFWNAEIYTPDGITIPKNRLPDQKNLRMKK